MVLTIAADEGFPHTRGGVSARRDLTKWRDRLSPHAWGCFLRRRSSTSNIGAFPTRVGVFPSTAGWMPPTACFPHTRGGVSIISRVETRLAKLSPHAWGCFHIYLIRLFFLGAFPTRVGVFPQGFGKPPDGERFPHTRGGVSKSCRPRADLWWLSPHAWGCFSSSSSPKFPGQAFPTRVGVFLTACAPSRPGPRFPHTRGGVSKTAPSRTILFRLSPHAWGCFWHAQKLLKQSRAFPTRVGVFLRSLAESMAYACFPHTRGGVS